MENKSIKTRNTIIAICLFVIAILLILLILLCLNSNIEKNNLQSQIDELEITNEENDNTFNTVAVEEELSKENNNPLNNILLTQEPINTDTIYGFATKEELIDDQYNYTLVAINKNDNSEIPIMNFSSGAYDYSDNKIYFYNEKNDEMTEFKK